MIHRYTLVERSRIASYPLKYAKVCVKVSFCFSTLISTHIYLNLSLILCTTWQTLTHSVLVMLNAEKLMVDSSAIISTFATLLMNS